MQTHTTTSVSSRSTARRFARSLLRPSLCASLVAATAFASCAARAAESPTPIRAESALFLALGQNGLNGPESFVVPVSGAARIAEIRQYLAERAAGTEKRPLIPTCIVALGSDGVNRNHSAPGRPLWGWHVTHVESVRRAQPELELYPAIPSVVGAPSAIENLLRHDRGSLPENRIALVHFPIVMELLSEFPAANGRLANISDRSFVGTGTQAKITGFVIEGDAPRRVVVRVLGPSLAAFDVPGTLSNPRFELYRGGEKVAENNDWPDGNLNRPHIAVVPPPSPFHLVPHDRREPALELSLAPGAYTIVVSSEDGSTGIALTEVHTL